MKINFKKFAFMVANATLWVGYSALSFAEDYSAVIQEQLSLASKSNHPASSLWQTELSVRTNLIRDAGFQPYSSNGSLIQASLGASRTIFSNPNAYIPWSFALGIRWDAGQSQANARAAEASFSTHRLSLAMDGRMYVTRWLSLFARFASGVFFEQAKIEDTSSNALVANAVVSSFDLSLGAAALVLPHKTPKPAARFWIAPEFGYGWVPSKNLVFHTNTDLNDPRRFGTIELRSVAPRGFFVRVGIWITF